jgi:hypothetical protein
MKSNLTVNKECPYHPKKASRFLELHIYYDFKFLLACTKYVNITLWKLFTSRAELPLFASKQKLYMNLGNVKIIFVGKV